MRRRRCGTSGPRFSGLPSHRTLRGICSGAVLFSCSSLQNFELFAQHRLSLSTGSTWFRHQKQKRSRKFGKGALPAPDVQSPLHDFPSSMLLSDGTTSTVQEVIQFLVCAVAIAPAAKAVNASPVLGFLLAGLVLGPAGFGVFTLDEDIKVLADVGILFLLFEQGLELSSDRLKKLAKYAFGLGTLQVVVTSLVISAVAFGGGTAALDKISQFDIIGSVTRTDQITVIAVSLALSSSAFVLQVLQERKLGQTLLGQAALGILLFQDISVVPLLVLLPLIEDQQGDSLNTGALAAYAATAVGGLAIIVSSGGFILRKVFDTVADTRRSETFVGLCILCVLGMGQLTESIGLSSSLGAFVAGTLLAESNYRPQVEADIAPFRGLLLGLFFLTTGAQVEPGLLLQEWQLSITLLLGFICCKTVVVATFAPLFELSLSESIRLGCLLAGGGEFAFVIFTLAGKFNVLPAKILSLLTSIVVISMALTPLLAELGHVLSSFVPFSKKDDTAVRVPGNQEIEDGVRDSEASSLTLVYGMGPVGLQVASQLANLRAEGVRWMGLSSNPYTVRALQKLGQPVFYGDGRRLSLLNAAGLDVEPDVIVITHSDPGRVEVTINRLRYNFPDVPIVTHTSDVNSFQKLSLAIAGPAAEGTASASTSSGRGFVFSDMTEVSLSLARAAISELGDIRKGAQASSSEYIRSETYRRKASPMSAEMSQADHSPDSEEEENERAIKAKAEVSTFFVAQEDDLLPERQNYRISSLIGSMTRDLDITAISFAEGVSVCQEMVIDGSELAALAGKIKVAGECFQNDTGLDERTYIQGEFVIRRGDEGREMFIVISGKCVAVLVEGEKRTFMEFGVGDHFGELALLLKQPYMVSVSATADARLLVVGETAFERMTCQCPVDAENSKQDLRP